MLTDGVDVPDAAPRRRSPPRRRATRRLARLRELLTRRGAPAGDRRRGRLDGADRRRRRGVLRGAAHPRRRLVPLPGLRRQPLARLRGPRRARRWTRRSPTRIRDADVLLGDRRAAGRDPDARLHAPASRAPAQRLVHVHPDPAVLGAVYQPELGDRVRSRGVRGARAAELAPAAAPRRGCSRRPTPSTSATCASTRAARARCSSPTSWRRCANGSGRDAILTNGAGNFTVWAHRFYEFRRYATQLAPRSGLDGLRRPGGGRREGRRTRTGPSSASPATATS